MSGYKPEMNRFYSALHARGLTAVAIAEQLGVSRCQVVKVLNGSRRRGPLWKRIAPLLTASEIELLDVALCSAWNKKRIEKRPVWTAEKAAMIGAREAVHA